MTPLDIALMVWTFSLVSPDGTVTAYEKHYDTIYQTLAECEDAAELADLYLTPDPGGPPTIVMGLPLTDSVHTCFEQPLAE